MSSLITWLFTRNTTEHALHAADTAHRRATRNYQEALDDTVDMLSAEIDAHQHLKAQHAQLRQRYDQAVYLVRMLADRSEAFRRTAMHLRRTWAPIDPEDLPLKASLTPLMDQFRADLKQDAEWQAKRERNLAEDLARPPS